MTEVENKDMHYEIIGNDPRDGSLVVHGEDGKYYKLTNIKPMKSVNNPNDEVDKNDEVTIEFRGVK